VPIGVLVTKRIWRPALYSHLRITRLLKDSRSSTSFFAHFPNLKVILDCDDNLPSETLQYCSPISKNKPIIVGEADLAVFVWAQHMQKQFKDALVILQSMDSDLLAIALLKTYTQPNLYLVLPSPSKYKRCISPYIMANRLYKEHGVHPFVWVQCLILGGTDFTLRKQWVPRLQAKFIYAAMMDSNSPFFNCFW
jgi:hypothetical protein